MFTILYSADENIYPTRIQLVVEDTDFLTSEEDAFSGDASFPHRIDMLRKRLVMVPLTVLNEFKVTGDGIEIDLSFDPGNFDKKVKAEVIACFTEVFEVEFEFKTVSWRDGLHYDAKMLAFEIKGLHPNIHDEIIELIKKKYGDDIEFVRYDFQEDLRS